MNNMLTILIFGIAFQINAQKITDTGNQWNVASLPTFYPGTQSYSIKIGEDTLLNNITYKTLYSSYDSLITNWNLTNQYLREDSLKRVFTFKNGKEELLYDFSLEVNDTFSIDSYYCNKIVKEIDSITLNNGEKRRRLIMVTESNQEYTEEAWIEGIGSDWGVLTNYGYCIFDFSQELLCYYNDNELLYPISPPYCYINTVDIEEIEIVDVEVFPNPCSEFLFVKNPSGKYFTYHLLNIEGKKLQKGPIENELNEIKTETLNPGIYILLVKDKSENVFSQKILKKG